MPPELLQKYKEYESLLKQGMIDQNTFNYLVSTLAQGYSGQTQTQPTQQQEDDFDYNEYFDIARADLLDDRNAGKITEAQYQTKAYELLLQIQRKVDIKDLPFYKEFRSTWASRLPVFLNSAYHQSPSGNVYDKSGNPVTSEVANQLANNFFPQAKSGEMDEGEREAAQLAREKFAYDQQQDMMNWNQRQVDNQTNASNAASNRAYQQQQLALQQLGMQTELDKEKQSQKFELWKSQTINQLNSPQDWIKRWEVMHTPSPFDNPFDPRPDITSAENAVALAEEGNQTSYGQMMNPTTLPPGVANAYNSWRANSKAMEDSFKLLQEATANYDEGRYVPMTQNPQPTGPNAPSWLPQFVQGQTAGQPITKAPITTPSGQQWTLTPESVKQGLSGYAEWAGGKSYEDILAELSRSLPKTPRGANYPRWSVRSQ